MGPTHGAAVGPHLVHFYADDDGLVASVAAFLAGGLYGGDGVVLIARPARSAALCEALRAEGFDIDPDGGAGQDGSVVVVDAGQLLDSFLTAGTPDLARFDQVVATPLRAAGRGRAGVRVYGEMVSLLWERGDVSAALVVEERWNDLLRDLSVLLYCAYPLTAVESPEYAPALGAACRLHSAILRADGSLDGHPSVYGHFEPTPLAAHAARMFVRRALVGEADDDLVASAVLVVSELATNAVAHAQSAFTVAVARLPGRVRISVRDNSPSVPVALPPSEESAGGRGLAMVASMARGWGTAALSGGKVVWAELDRVTAGAVPRMGATGWRRAGGNLLHR